MLCKQKLILDAINRYNITVRYNFYSDVSFTSISSENL